jgi:outer membrane protein
MKRSILIVLLSVPFLLAAQETLNTEEMLSAVLKNSLGLKLAEQSVRIAEIQNNPGAAGLLPTVSLNAGATYSNNNSELTIIGQPNPIEVNGAEATQLNAGLTVNYTIFNGFSGKNTLTKLQIQEDLADVSKRSQVELMIASSLQAYYQAAGLQQSLDAAKQSLEISADRLERSKLKYEYGGQSRLEYLSAQVDYSNDSASYLKAQLALNQAKRQLNYLMARESGVDFELNASLSFQELPDLSTIESKAKENNAQLRNARMNIMLAEQDLKVANSGYYPRVNLNAGYNFISSENEASVLSQQVSYGLNTGISLSYSIFSGNQRRNNVKISQIRMQNEMLKEEDAGLQMKRDLQNAWDRYTVMQKLVEVEESNLKTAGQNFKRSDELFSLGAISNVQFRDAQLNLLRSRIRLVQAKYDLKLAEVEILRVSGQLLASE